MRCSGARSLQSWTRTHVLVASLDDMVLVHDLFVESVVSVVERPRR